MLAKIKSCVSAIFQAMMKMFTDCNLVHGDLSEFNILYHENDVYIIDVSQVILLLTLEIDLKSFFTKLYI